MAAIGLEKSRVQIIDLKFGTDAFLIAQGFEKQQAESSSGPAPFFEIAVFQQGIAQKKNGKQHDGNAGMGKIDKRRNPKGTQMD